MRIFVDVYLSIEEMESDVFSSLLIPGRVTRVYRFAGIPFSLRTEEESLGWIKIAGGAISRTHDIGENAAEALIMPDTRRGSCYHVLPLNSRLSLY